MRALARQESGQTLVLMLMLIVALIAVGVVVYQLIFSTDLAAQAQTAADAAALAGENNVVYQLEHPRPYGPIIDPAEVQQAAESYAGQNDGNVLGSVQILPSSGGYDVLVTVQTNQGLPQNSVDGGATAVREARASTDPFGSGASTAALTGNDPASASNPTGTFTPHGGEFGFFEAPGTNYTVGSEPQIAADLDAMGQALHLHLVGISGYRTPAQSAALPRGSADDPHTCGAASDTEGTEGIPESTLERYGLTRPIPGADEADHMQLLGTNGSVCVGGSGAIPVATPVSLGNPNPHLVPLAGGPDGSAVLGGGGGPSLGPSGGWAIPYAVVNCESSGQNLPPNSASASGYYQITAQTWNGFGGYPAAYLAPKSVQDAKAAQLMATRGLEPWTASEPCWGPIIGFQA